MWAFTLANWDRALPFWNNIAFYRSFLKRHIFCGTWLISVALVWLIFVLQRKWVFQVTGKTLMSMTVIALQGLMLWRQVRQRVNLNDKGWHYVTWQKIRVVYGIYNHVAVPLKCIILILVIAVLLIDHSVAMDVGIKDSKHMLLWEE